MNKNIEGKNVILTFIEYADTKNIVNWRNKEFVKERFIYRNTLTRETHEKWLKEEVETGNVQQFIIRVKSENKAIGSVYLRNIDYNNKNAEFGIFIGERDWLGKGIGKEVTKLMVEYAFAELKLHKINLRVLDDNKRAIKCYESVGFKEQGIFIDEVRVDEEYYNVKFMYILNPL